MTSSVPSPSEQLALLRSSRAVAIVAGILALAGGIVVLAWSDKTGKGLAAIAIIVGIVLVIIGLAQIVDALMTRRAGTYWGLLLLKGVLDLAVGVAAIVWPDITVRVVVLLIGIEFIVSGVVALITARQVPKELEQHSRFMWRGIISIVVGLIVVIWPEATVMVVAIVFGVYLVILGLVLLWAGYQLGKAERISAA